jgi:hypothetical protein
LWLRHHGGSPEGPLAVRTRGNGRVGGRTVEHSRPAQVLGRAGACAQMWVQVCPRSRLNDNGGVRVVRDEGAGLGGTHQGVWWGRVRTGWCNWQRRRRRAAVIARATT